jgi:hypothetical protein
MITSCCCGFKGKNNDQDHRGSYGHMRKICWRGVHSSQAHGPRNEENGSVHQEKVSIPSDGKPDYESLEVPLGMESFVRQGT